MGIDIMLNIAITRGENWSDKGFLGYDERYRLVALAHICYFTETPNRLLMADWMRSPTAALWPSNSQNQDISDWPVWRNVTDRNGSPGDPLLFRFIAGKLSLNSET